MSAHGAPGPLPAANRDASTGGPPEGPGTRPRADDGERRAARAPSRRGRDLAAWLTLALATLAILWPLGLTNRVLAGVDALTYFTPYWAYRMAELRAGHVPLWNPYLFLGAPFLANPQAAVLYPLHWPLSWLKPEQALAWSALLHAWLAAGFTYSLGRRSLGLSRPAAWLAGLIFGLGGFTLARAENINQLNALAWLPALLWLYDETARAAGWRPRVRWGAALAAVSALQLLAGHTQTAFINLVGLGLWAVWPVLVALWARVRGRRGGAGAPGSGGAGERGGHLLPLIALVPALLLFAGQLLPTLELNQLGLRTGGLPFRQAVSFSLRPRLLAQSLLPPFGGGLAQAFGSEGYAEFVGYVGLVGLALAALGLIRRRAARSPVSVQRAVLLAAAGFLLALGAFNPLYYLLWRFIPGFDLFRAPARWLELYTLGVALLAGTGLDAIGRESGAQERIARPGPAQGPAAAPCDELRAHHASETKHARRRIRRWRLVYLLPLLLGLLALAAIQQPPPWPTLIGWIGGGAAAGALLVVGRRRPAVARAGLIGLACAELWLGARALPFTEATAPSATDLRNAPAALLAATAAQPEAGRDRFLSLSDIRFDPGDLAELRASQAGRLPAAASERLVRAAKQMEVLAPNLPLLLRLPAVDGYDGGVLPLKRYVELQGLFLPPERLLPDGRLREQLPGVPEDRLLDLTGVRYLITDKQHDLWADDVYYDLELPARLEPGQALTLDLSAYPPFPATALGVVAEAAGAAPDGARIAGLTVEGADGRSAGLDLPAGPGTRDGAAPVRLPEPLTPARITVRVPADAPALTLRGLSLIDERTGTHSSVTVSPRGDIRRIHSGDVKVYERLGTPGRAWLVHGVMPAADDAAALALLGDPAFDPRASAVVAGDAAASPAGAAAPGEAVSVVAYDPERVVLRADVARPAVLVLADAFYPGWEATVDGAPAPILRTNLMFRGLALAPGSHEVVFTYRPAGWQRGAWISLGTLLLLCIAVAMASLRPRHTPGVRAGSANLSEHGR